jgi:hypothetical protein
MVSSQLTLVVPGLFGPFPAGNEMLPDPSLPALLGLLRCARPLQNDAAEDPDAWLCARFGITRAPECDWPLAPLLAELELGDAGQDYWLRADPVHLRADRSRLVLFGPEALAIRQEEADALAEGFNALYQPDGLRLYTPTPNRWYLRLAQAPRLSNTPLPDVIGRDIDRHLPRGEDAGPWHARLNEIQMLFHTHGVNERRAEQGQPGINSLWLWGGGRMPASLQAKDAWVCSDDPLTRALARAANVPVLEPDVAPEDWLPSALGSGTRAGGPYCLSSGAAIWRCPGVGRTAPATGARMVGTLANIARRGPAAGFRTTGSARRGLPDQPATLVATPAPAATTAAVPGLMTDCCRSGLWPRIFLPTMFAAKGRSCILLTYRQTT